MTPPARYTTLVACLLAGLLLVISALNLLVDPYGIYAVWVRPSINAQKPGMHGHDRMVKAYAMAALRPDATLLGTSRVQYSMDPNAAELRAVAQRPHNAGLLNCSMYLAWRYLQHAQALAPQRLVLLGLDPLMFDWNTQYDNSDFLEGRLAVDQAGSPNPAYAKYADLAPTLLSWDALGLSGKTLLQQGSLVSDLLPNGQRSPVAIDRYFRSQGSLFHNIEYVEKIYLRDYRTAQLDFPRDGGGAYAILAQMLDFARAQHIDLQIYLTPTHAILGETARAVGKLAALETWKKNLVTVVAEHNARYPTQPPQKLWDFTAPGHYTAEMLPQSRGDPQTLTYFWEATHHRPDLGRLIVRRLLDLPPQGEPEPFGVILSPANIAAELQRQRQAQDSYAATHPDDVARVRALELQGRHSTTRLY